MAGVRVQIDDVAGAAANRSSLHKLRREEAARGPDERTLRKRRIRRQEREAAGESFADMLEAEA